jgi:hypothetical protein
MFTRILLVASLVGGALFAADPVTKNSNESAKPAVSAVLDLKSQSCANTPRDGNATAAGQSDDDSGNLFAQVILASACVTYAGSCPLLTALPVGVLCTCYTPYGPVSGVAR